MRIFFSIVCLFSLISCATSHSNVARAPENISVKEDKIYVNGMLHAEILKVYPLLNSCRGIVIHYFRSGTYKWISPNGGLQLKDMRTGEVVTDIPAIIRLWDRFQPDYNILKNNKSAESDGYFKMDWRFDVQISEDGQFIIYTEQTANSLFGGKKKRYKVVYHLNAEDVYIKEGP